MTKFEEDFYKDGLKYGTHFQIPKLPEGLLIFYKGKWLIGRTTFQFIEPTEAMVIELLGLRRYLDFLFEQKYGN